MSSPKKGAERRQSVLFVHEHGVEWLSSRSDGERYARVDVETSALDVAALADAAIRACAQDGGSKRDIVLAVGEGLVHHRLVELPLSIASAAGAELDRALQRKAAALLGVELHDALFAAALVDPGSDGRDDARPTSWLVTAFAKGVVPALHRALRRKGLPIQRIASLRLCSASTATARRVTQSGACIVIAVEPSCVTLTLVHGGVVVNIGTLRGSFVHEPALAMTLLQEIKGLDIHWRKQSRGESVGEILLLGFPHDRCELLVGALKNVHKDVAVTVLRDERQEIGRDEASRVELLRSCRSTSGLQIDLTPRARAHRGRRLAIAGTALALASALAWWTWDQGRAGREDRQRVLADLEARGADLESLARRSAEVHVAIDRLRRSVERRHQLARAGIDVGAVLETVRASFAHVGALSNLRLAPSDGGTEVEIEGEAGVEPVRAAADIARLVRSLEQSPVFSGVEVAAAPLPSSPKDPVRFRLTARLEEGG